jgi:hypothetical protein
LETREITGVTRRHKDSSARKRESKNEQLTGQSLDHFAERGLETLLHLSDGRFFRKQRTLELADAVLSLAQPGLKGLKLSRLLRPILGQQQNLLCTKERLHQSKNLGNSTQRGKVVPLTAQRIPVRFDIDMLSPELVQRVDEGLQHKISTKRSQQDVLESVLYHGLGG